jgi:hypothetical protein
MGMARPNKRRRKLNQLRDTRNNLTKVRSSIDEERVGLVGYEEYYEITKNGGIYSKRLKRFIKHKFNPIGSYTYIEFTINKQKINYSIGEAIARSYLRREQIVEIKNELPKNIKTVEDLKGLALINELASKYKIHSSAIFYLLKVEIDELRKELT